MRENFLFDSLTIFIGKFYVPWSNETFRGHQLLWLWIMVFRLRKYSIQLGGLDGLHFFICAVI